MTTNGVSTGPTGRHITTREAMVHTVSVEVRSLTISKKQVTLSVFRQLINEDLIDPNTCELNGVPWGIVNYFWGDCKPDHLHAVWQKGDSLRRACVRPTWPLKETLKFQAREAAQTVWRVFDWHIAHDALRRNLPPPKNWLTFDEQHNIVLELGQLTFRHKPQRQWLQYYLNNVGGLNHDTLRRLMDEEASEICKEFSDADWFDGSMTTEDVLLEANRDHGRICREHDTLNPVYAKQYTAVAALEQLFIAV